MAYSNSIIPSSSSSSALMTLPRNHYYDVFVSFRGADTRYNFTGHLFASLQRKGIVSFRDDTKLPKGESIAPELLCAIEASQIYVVVFSRNYASSTWCLRELEYILECVQVSRKHVLPVFYDVDPSEVRKQSGSYAEAFAGHEERFKQDLQMVHRWRAALTQVASLSGWDVRDKPQYAEIEKIVEEIINVLSRKFSSLPSDLVGIHSPIEDLEKLLLLDSVDDVRVVGICGMGGIGKTTLATILYGRISHHFDACCLIDDVSKIYRDDGPLSAQQQILHQTLCEEHLQICNSYTAANSIRSRLRRLRALLVLDNVDQLYQLEKLEVNREWLGAGSRIIIISRDEHILKEYGVDIVYKVPLLNEANSLQLFCQKAFKLDNIISNYEKLAYNILYYANGLPLAIKVLGSFLFGRDMSEWKSALTKLRDSPSKDIMDVLRLSFDVLDDIEKEIFLDIACFFNRHEENYVKKALNCCGFHADIGLRVLVDKSLISISYKRSIFESEIEMHGLLEDLGRKIVQENSAKEPRKWSRLWHQKHFYNVMSENMENNVEAIVLERGTDILMVESLSNMNRLRLLILSKVDSSGSLNYLSNELRYFQWHEYPFKYLPSNFQPNQLVELHLMNSNIRQLWKGKKHLPNLITLNLSHSENLVKMPAFGEVPNLERLNLEGCVRLVQMDPSIGVLEKLVSLNLKDCKNLRSIPNSIFGIISLKDLNLSGCPNVFNNPWHLKWTKVLPFHSLYPKEHKDLLTFLPCFSYLRELNISFCSLSQIPETIGCLRWLERLNLGGNNFLTLPSLKELSSLVYLNLEHCKQLESLPELPVPIAIKENHPMSQDWRDGGLYIFNCPNLGGKDQCSSMTFSWLIQFIQANQQSSIVSLRLTDIGVVIPGSEIPRWFKNQSAGDSISMDPSPIMQHDNDNNFIGVACCVVFSVGFYNISPTLTTYASWRSTIGLGFTNGDDERYICIPVIIDRDLITIKSNHMCLIYFPRESFFGFLSLMNTTPWDIKMATRIMDGHGLNVEVSNCGYRWVFKKDLQLMHGENSLAQKHNFLAILE